MSMCTAEILSYKPLLTTPTFGAMVVAVLTLYIIGTAVKVLAVLHGLVDSVGGLMYVQNQRHCLEFHQEKQRRNNDL